MGRALRRRRDCVMREHFPLRGENNARALFRNATEKTKNFVRKFLKTFAEKSGKNFATKFQHFKSSKIDLQKL
jgi:hypothetical protein